MSAGREAARLHELCLGGEHRWAAQMRLVSSGWHASGGWWRPPGGVDLAEAMREAAMSRSMGVRLAARPVTRRAAGGRRSSTSPGSPAAEVAARLDGASGRSEPDAYEAWLADVSETDHDGRRLELAEVRAGNAP